MPFSPHQRITLLHLNHTIRLCTLIQSDTSQRVGARSRPMLTAVAVRRDVIDPDLFDFDPLGQFLPDYPSGTDHQFWFADPYALLPVLHRGRIILTRWGCHRGECRILPCTGWTTTRGAESQF